MLTRVICRMHIDAQSQTSDMESVTIEELNKKHIS
jgi:hypothetical protein